MGYGDYKSRMSASKNAKSYGKEGNAVLGGERAFSKKGPEFQVLTDLMERHGSNMQMLTPALICQEEPSFIQYKPNSLKGAITSIKKKHSERGFVEQCYRKSYQSWFFPTISQTHVQERAKQ